MFILEKGDDHTMNQFNNSLLYSLSLDVYLVENISLRINFQRVSSVGERLCYSMRLSNTCVMTFNLCLLSNLLVVP